MFKTCDKHNDKLQKPPINTQQNHIKSKQVQQHSETIKTQQVQNF